MVVALGRLAGLIDHALVAVVFGTATVLLALGVTLR